MVFTSNSAGAVSGHATVSLTLDGVSLTRSTDGVSPNSGDAVKRFVDAKISITPDEVNEVGQPHTFTVHVEVDVALISHRDREVAGQEGGRVLSE